MTSKEPKTMELRLYTTPDCQGCKGIKRMLDREGVTYEEIDLIQPGNADVYDYVVKDLGYTQTPVLEARFDYGGRWSFYGYRPGNVRSMIARWKEINEREV